MRGFYSRYVLPPDFPKVPRTPYNWYAIAVIAVVIAFWGGVGYALWKVL